MNTERTNITRRGLVGATALGIAALGASSLTGCASETATDRIDAANEEIIASLDISNTRLPLGSVVETSYGRWMIIGQNPTMLNEDETERWAYKYQVIAWPRGVGVTCYEYMASALIQDTDIEKVLFIGRVNDEERDFRTYVDTLNFSNYADGVVFSGPTGVLNELSETGLEQQMRLQGAMSQDLYGDAFNGGLLYGNVTEKQDEIADAADQVTGSE